MGCRGGGCRCYRCDRGRPGSGRWGGRAFGAGHAWNAASWGEWTRPLQPTSERSNVEAEAPAPAAEIVPEEEIDVVDAHWMALTMWGEARNGGEDGDAGGRACYRQSAAGRDPRALCHRDGERGVAVQRVEQGRSQLYGDDEHRRASRPTAGIRPCGWRRSGWRRRFCRGLRRIRPGGRFSIIRRRCRRAGRRGLRRFG